MANKRSGIKSRRGAATKTGERTTKKKAVVRDLDVRGIRGGSIKGGDSSKTFYSWQK